MYSHELKQVILQYERFSGGKNFELRRWHNWILIHGGDDAWTLEKHYRLHNLEFDTVPLFARDINIFSRKQVRIVRMLAFYGYSVSPKVESLVKQFTFQSAETRASEIIQHSVDPAHAFHTVFAEINVHNAEREPVGTMRLKYIMADASTYQMLLEVVKETLRAMNIDPDLSVDVDIDLSEIVGDDPLKCQLATHKDHSPFLDVVLADMQAIAPRQEPDDVEEELVLQPEPEPAVLETIAPRQEPDDVEEELVLQPEPEPAVLETEIVEENPKLRPFRVGTCQGSLLARESRTQHPWNHDSNLTAKDNDAVPGLEAVSKEFVAMGGTIYGITTPFESESDSHSHLFCIDKRDVVYPICHAGQNRSQVMYKVLHKLKQQLEVPLSAIQNSLTPTHGVYTGFDPNVLSDRLTDENWTEYVFGAITDEDPHNLEQNNLIEKALGTRRVKRYGREYMEAALPGKSLNIDYDRPNFSDLHQTRSTMREYFNTSLWRNSPRKRQIYVCFDRAPVIAMTRIVENNDDCSNMYIIALPWGDPMNSTSDSSKTKEDQDRAYVEMYQFMYNQYSKLFCIPKKEFLASSSHS